VGVHCFPPCCYFLLKLLLVASAETFCVNGRRVIRMILCLGGSSNYSNMSLTTIPAAPNKDPITEIQFQRKQNRHGRTNFISSCSYASEISFIWGKTLLERKERTLLSTSTQERTRIHFLLSFPLRVPQPTLEEGLRKRGLIILQYPLLQISFHPIWRNSGSLY